MAEIVRAGMISVDEGQSEAAQALGMTRLLTMRRIVLPQAMRVIIPPTGNETISMLKTTSLVSVIAVTGAALLRADHLRADVPDDPAPHRREHLVPDRHDRSCRSASTTSSATSGAALAPDAAACFERLAHEPPARFHGGSELTMSEPMVKAEGVHKRFGRLEVLKGISLEVQPGEVMCILGPSGSGKTTFIRCINHLEKIDVGPALGRRRARRLPAAGDKLYELRDAEVCRKRAEIGMVFQRFNLFPHMTALENVIEAPIRVKRIPKDRAAAAAKELLDRVGLADKVDSYPAQLSGGQQQRVAIARALAMKPEADALRRADLRPRPRARRRGARRHAGARPRRHDHVVVTHEMGFAREVGRPGRVHGRRRSSWRPAAGASSVEAPSTSGRSSSSPRSSRSQVK